MSQRPPRARLLFVDDEPLIHDALARQLHGYRDRWSFTFLSDPVEAAVLLRHEKFDALLTDYRMPGMTGLDLCAAARAADPTLATLILTGHMDLDLALKAINDLDVFRLYTKPCPLSDLVPGLEAAISETRRRREEQTEARGDIGASHAAIPRALFELQPDGQIRWMNQQAAQMLQKADALTALSNGSLTPAVAEERRRFHQAVSSVIRTGTEISLSVETLDPADRLLLTLSGGRPQADTQQSGHVVTLVAVSRASRPEIDLARLRGLFDFTENEARLAALLAVGLSLTDAAEALSLKESSARTYLKTVFAKMGVSRQPELVKVVLTSTAVIQAPIRQ